MEFNRVICEQLITYNHIINAKSRLQAFVASVKDAFAPKLAAVAVAA